MRFLLGVATGVVVSLLARVLRRESTPSRRGGIDDRVRHRPPVAPSEVWPPAPVPGVRAPEAPADQRGRRLRELQDVIEGREESLRVARDANRPGQSTNDPEGRRRG